MGIGSQLSNAAQATGKTGAVSASKLKELVAIAQKKRKLPPLTRQEFDDVLRMAQRSEDIKDVDTLIRLEKTPGFADEAAVEPVAEAGAARPFGQVGKQFVSEADPSVIVRRLDKESFVYPDGIVVDVDGNVLGKTAVDDLTDVGGDTKIDNLDASATDLGDEGASRKGGKANLTPNTKKVDATKELADAIWQSTTPTDLESTSQQSLKRLLREAQKQRTADGYSPEFLAKFPNAEAGAERLARLEEMAGVSNADRAAEQIDTAAQARGVANTPRPPAGNRAATSADFKAAKELVGETIPAGDWNALTDAFNKLDEVQRQSVLSGLPMDTRRFLSQMLDPNQQAPSFVPNLVATKTRPINEFDELIAQRDAASAAGDTETAATLTDLLSGQGAAPQDQITDAIRAINERAAASSALRNALLGQDEMVSAEKARMLRAAVPQPQPAAVTPGARSPEFAAEDVPDAEMPTAFDIATAARKEAQTAVEARAAGGGMPEKARMEAMGLDATDTQRDLPLFLRGRDRNPPLESRNRGERSIESNDLRAIDKAQELESEVNAALKEAKTATGTAALAAAKNRLAAAYAAMDKAYPPRLVSQRTGEAKALPAGMDKPPKGWVIERGRRAMSDSRLNKGGQQQTYDEAILAMTGFRPKPQESINRANTGLSTADAASMSTEANRIFGDDANGLLDGDFDPDWSVDPTGRSHAGLDLEANGSMKPGRLGGQQQASRVEGAAQLMFGDTNPFGMTDDNRTLLFANADAVAEEMLSRGTLFKPGTWNYDLAKARIAQVIDRKFAGAAKTNPKTVTAAKKQAKNTAEFIPDPDEPDGTVVLDDAASSPAIDNLEASATEIGGKPKRKGKKTAPATDGSTPIPPVTGKMKSVEEIQSEADVIEREARRQAIDDGYATEDADTLGRQARKAHVDTEMAARRLGADDVEPATGATPELNATPDAAATPDAPKTDPIEPATGADPVRLADEDQIDAPKPADTDSPAGPTKPSTSETVVEVKKPGLIRRTMGRLKLPAIIGGITAIGIGASNMGGGGGGTPPTGGGGGGGGGTGGGGGDFFPIPVGAGTDGSTLMDEDARAAEEARLNRALDRIRGRATTNKTPTFQTLQNYNGWR
jgi:hypothetical protein